MGFQLVPELVTLNNLERRNNRRGTLSLRQLSFLLLHSHNWKLMGKNKVLYLLTYCFKSVLLMTLYLSIIVR